MNTSDWTRFFVTVIVLAAASGHGDAQDLEPRRWSHLPLGTNVAGGGYAYTSGDIAFDPVLRLEDVELDLHAGAFKYVRSFELLGKSAHLDFLQGYRGGRGLLLVVTGVVPRLSPSAGDA